MSKTNFNNLNEVVAYAQKLGKSMITLDAENPKGNYNISPLCRPDLILRPSVAIIWLPQNWRQIWASFDYSKTPQFSDIVEPAFKKLETFKEI